MSGDFFRTLGVRAVLGRVFTAADDRRGCAAPPAVISYGFWQREYGGSPSALGRTLTLDGHAFDIVGVTPAGFFGVEVGRSFDVAVPLCAEPLTAARESSLDRQGRLVPRRDRPAEAGLVARTATAQLDAHFAAAVQARRCRNYRPEDEKPYLAFTLARVPAGTGVVAVCAATTSAAVAAARDHRRWCCSSPARTSPT